MLLMLTLTALIGTSAPAPSVLNACPGNVGELLAELKTLKLVNPGQSGHHIDGFQTKQTRLGVLASFVLVEMYGDRVGDVEYVVSSDEETLRKNLKAAFPNAECVSTCSAMLPYHPGGKPQSLQRISVGRSLLMIDNRNMLTMRCRYAFS